MELRYFTLAIVGMYFVLFATLANTRDFPSMIVGKIAPLISGIFCITLALVESRIINI